MTRFAWTLAVVAIGCSNKLSGSLDINGNTFTPTSCENLQRIGQRGVELHDDAYKKIRIVERPDGSADVYWFASSGKGTKIADCATLTVRDQNSTVNKVKNIMGTAKLDCSKGDDEIKGNVTFENCH